MSDHQAIQKEPEPSVRNEPRIQHSFSESVIPPSLNRKCFSIFLLVSCPFQHSTVLPASAPHLCTSVYSVSRLLLPRSFCLDLSPDFRTAFFSDINPHYNTSTKSPLSFCINIKLPLDKDMLQDILWGFGQAITELPSTQMLSPGQFSCGQASFQKRLDLNFSSSSFCCMRPVQQSDPIYTASSVTPFHTLLFPGTHNTIQKFPLAFKAFFFYY